ncbi:MAG: hypothetical protein LUQ50_12335 [Methanospirillum sp.]|uniref:hypothetical protein n=1 Tax=Methanospirillum sp. TaxID=45200 RepID=UPI0023754D0B|nr:hypothetical protein [Methanospirillum sp.]MDD1729845.1 hypothetical protein [Methanospirillum sp.]
MDTHVQYRNNPFILFLVILIPGIIGCFMQPIHCFTTIALVLSILVIPGAFCVRYLVIQKMHPIITSAAVILISITVLTLYLLCGELTGISMTSDSTDFAVIGEFFQLGILVYASIFTFMGIGIPVTNHDSDEIIPSNACSHEVLSGKSIVGIILIVALFSFLIVGILPLSQQDKTTELYFSQPSGCGTFEQRATPDVITVTNHEGIFKSYTLLITQDGNQMPAIPVHLSNGESFTEDITDSGSPGTNTGLKNLQVQLFSEQQAGQPYREIWRNYNP